MNRIGIALLLVIAGAVLPSIAGAQKNTIYSWTDENGLKHFSDQAPVGVPATRKEIPVAAQPVAEEAVADPLNNEPGDNAVATQTAVADDLSYADQQRLDLEEKRKAKQEKQLERQRMCLKAREELARVEPNRRVYYSGKDGETTRMDDVERVTLVEENKQLIAEYCD